MNSDLCTSLLCKDVKCMGAFRQFGSGRNWVVIQLLVIPGGTRCCIRVNFMRFWFESICLWLCLFFLYQGHHSRRCCFRSSPQNFSFGFSNSLMVQHYAQGHTCLYVGPRIELTTTARAIALPSILQTPTNFLQPAITTWNVHVYVQTV